MTRWPKGWRSSAPGIACPSCGASTGRPILMGMSTDDVFAAMDAGEINIFLGACCKSDDDPTHRCAVCGVSFASSRRQEIR